MDSVEHVEPRGACTLCEYQPVSQLRHGMVLARPVLAMRSGRMTLSLPTGTECSDAVIEQLRAHDTEWVCIALNEPPTEAELETKRAAAWVRLRQLFRRADMSSATTAALFQALLDFRGVR